MSARDHDSDWKYERYEAPEAEFGQLDSEAMATSTHKKAVAVTHDLTNAELRRFYGFDVYYDPKPMLGFIPQWVVLALIGAAIGALASLTAVGSSRAIAIRVLTLPVVFVGIVHVHTAALRFQARTFGLCKGRTVTVCPAGLSVEIPGARQTPIPAIGELSVVWSRIPRISVSDDDLTFWMRPTLRDPEGRARVIVPLRVFGDFTEAAAFENAARYWHAAATGGDPHWWHETGR